MIPYKIIEKKLKQLGYTGDQNISDFWFKNKERLMPQIYGKGQLNERFSFQVRWKSDIGIVCQNAIRTYIENHVKANRERVRNEIFDSGNFSKLMTDPSFKNHQSIQAISKVFIDFEKFTFNYMEKQYSLNEFEYIFPLSRSSYLSLEGIDLSGIHIENCGFRNCSFSNATFNNSHIYQVQFENCSLAYCSFKHACFGNIILINTLVGGDFQRASIFALNPLNDKTIHIPFIYKKISYFNLLRFSFLTLINKHNLNFENIRYTHFTGISTKDLNADHLSELKNYIDWYQKSIDYTHHKRNTFKQRFAFFLSVLFTKNWTSFLSLAFSYLVIHVFFALCIFFGNNHFSASSNSFNPDLFQAFYHSIITFSLLGYGDIQPVDNIGRIMILFDAFTGYILLGLFIFLLSRKIEKKI